MEEKTILSLWVTSITYRYLQSPSYFNATSGNAKEWNLNSAGYLNNGWNVTNSLGARPDSCYDRKQFYELKSNGYGFYLEEVIFNILKIVYLQIGNKV